MEKRGQAAMEFLMTYGWAILVVLVAIGALAYFGVLSPSKFLPSSCTIESGFGCDSFKADDSADTVQLLLRNGRGQSLSAISVAVAGCTNSAEANGNATWTDGEVLGGADGITVTSCSLGAVNDRVKKDITLSYTDSSGISHSVVGDLTTKVEA